MDTNVRCAVVIVSVVLGTIQGFAVDGTRINGRAVSARWRYSYDAWAPTYNDAQGDWCGAIDLFTINGGRVARTDTIFKATQGLCYNPSFDINGTKVAFYRLGRALSTTRNMVSANGGKTTVSVMNIDGTGIVNLVDCAGEPVMHNDGDGGLDWPAGDWIYYLKPVSGGGNMNELWKVNVSTKQNVSVCTYGLGGGRFRRMSLSLAANKIGNQVIDGSWFNSGVDPFPNGCSINGRGGGCNSCVSPSGNYQAKFMGDHTELLLDVISGASGVRNPPTNINNSGGPFEGVVLRQFQAKTSDQFGNDVEGVGFSCNSDKWVLQHVGWYGHADLLQFGTEQVACNWADMACIRISNNGKKPRETCASEGRPGPDCCGGCGAVFYGNEFGDLWVDGGQSNAGKYEDGDGIWHSVPGAGTDYIPISTVHAFPASPPERSSAAMRVVAMGRSPVIALPWAAAWRIDVLDRRGRVVAAEQTVSSQCVLDLRSLSRGTYALRACSRWGTTSRNLVVE